MSCSVLTPFEKQTTVETEHFFFLDAFTQINWPALTQNVPSSIRNKALNIAWKRCFDPTVSSDDYEHCDHDPDHDASQEA